MKEDLTIPGVFNESVCSFADKVALQIKKETLWQPFTYQQTQELSLKTAAFLIRAGLKKGDCVALILENRPEWVIIYFGIMYAGLVCVPLDPQLSQQETINLILDSQAKVIFCSYGIFAEKLKQALKGAPVKTVILDIENEEDKNLIDFSAIENIPAGEVTLPAVYPADIASLIYTSGTTAKPKGVLLSQRNICSNFKSIQKLNLCFPSDNFLSILPLYHSYAFMVTLIVPLFLGARITYCASFRPDELSRIIREAKVTVLAGVPQLFSLLHKAIFEKLGKPPFILRPLILLFVKANLRSRFGSLRLLVSGGARLEPKTGSDLTSLGLKLVEGYGLTETSPVVSFNPPQKIKFGSVGKPLPDVEIKLLNPDEKGIGQVLIKGPNVMEGYFKQPDLTLQVIKEGWLYSGDLGRIDKEGYLYLVGREKEVIVLSSGKNIYPEELEEYYSRSAYIKEICIIHKEEKIFGYLKESLFAVIVPDLEYASRMKEVNIRGKIRWDLETSGRKLAPYLHIMGFALSKEELPRTPLGKIKRYAVREEYLQAQPQGIRTIKEEFSEEDAEILNKDISQKIIRYISREVNKPVYIDSHLEIDLGIDSLSRVELGLGLEALFKTKIPDELLYSVSTIKDVIINLENLIEGAPEAIRQGKERGWEEILREAPPDGIIKKIKINFGLFERLFTAVFKNIFLFVFRLFWMLRIEGKENLPLEGPYLICPNHASYLDGLFIFSSLPFENSMETYFLGYQRIFEHPAFRWANKICRFISIDVGSHLSEAMQAVSYVLAQRKIVCIFPEGMRSIDTQVKEFKKGAGILIKELDIPVVPVYIKGSHQSWPRGSRLPRFYPVKVIFGRPLSRQQLGADYEAIARRLREEVLKLL